MYWRLTAQSRLMSCIYWDDPNGAAASFGPYKLTLVHRTHSDEHIITDGVCISFRRTQPPSTEVRTNQRSHCHGLIRRALDRNASAGNIFSVVEHNGHAIDWGRNAGTDFIGYGPIVYALIPYYKYQLTHWTPSILPHIVLSHWPRHFAYQRGLPPYFHLV